MTDEYGELQKLRALWSKAIVTRDYIFIPLVLGIVAISFSQLPNFPPDWRISFLIFEGALLTFSTLYWRKLSSTTDRAIVGLYGRMLELEKVQKMNIQTKYFYNHLKTEYRKSINEKIGIDPDNKIFKKFLDAAEAVQQDYHYDLLLEKWNEHEYDSVTPRGHEIHERFAYGLIAAYWVLLLIATIFFQNVLLIEI